ncbi:AraC family transcriptional regulator [Paenibacillus sp. P25]|nr:AraC family transcriptional regulator [Paenibacillus sp. P25]
MVSQPKLFQLMNDVTPEEKGTTLVIDNNGDILLTGHNGAAPTPFDNVLHRSIGTNIRANQTDGTYSLKYGNDTYFVSFGMFERVGKKWTYLSATPLSQITRPVVVLSRILLAVSGAGFTFAVILAWLASSRIHKPIGRLVGLFQLESKRPDPAETKDEIALIEREWWNLHRESQVLQIRLESSLPSLRDGFLLQLVQGHLNYMSEDELLERMEKLDWDASRKQYGFLIMRLIGFSNLLGRFSEGDEQLVTFAVANIAEEIAGRRYDQIGVVNFQDLSVGILLFLPDTLTHAETKESIIQLADELIQTVNAVLKVHLVISIGRTVDSLRSIADMAEGVKETLRLREFQTGNQVIDSEKVSPSQESVFYPFSLEKEIVQAFRLGEEDQAVLYIDQFIDELLRHSAKAMFVQQGMLKLLSSVHHVLLQTGFQLQGAREGALYERLFELEGPDEMRQWFKLSVIQPYMKVLRETRNVHAKLRVEKVMSYIEAHYMEDISLDLCADQEFTTPKALSADFKRFAGMNFIDYLTQYRMNRAKEPLRETDMKINEIAENVGYQPSYFIRIFKKAEGLTPGQYRENVDGNVHDHHE